MLYAILAALLIALDQATKIHVYNNRVALEDVTLIPGFFHLTYLENRGAAFSILQNARWFFIVLTAAAIVLMLRLMLRNRNVFFRLCLSILLAGAVGNMIDRVLRGFVIDFLHFWIFKWDFPVFNVADIAVSVGCGLFFIYMAFIHKDPVPAGSEPDSDRMAPEGKRGP